MPEYFFGFGSHGIFGWAPPCLGSRLPTGGDPGDGWEVKLGFRVELYTYLSRHFINVFSTFTLNTDSACGRGCYSICLPLISHEGGTAGRQRSHSHCGAQPPG